MEGNIPRCMRNKSVPKFYTVFYVKIHESACNGSQPTCQLVLSKSAIYLLNTSSKVRLTLKRGVKSSRVVTRRTSMLFDTSEDSLLASTEYGADLTACAGKGNVFGCQILEVLFREPFAEGVTPVVIPQNVSAETAHPAAPRLLEVTNKGFKMKIIQQSVNNDYISRFRTAELNLLRQLLSNHGF